MKPGNVIVGAGAVIAVLLGIPSMFIGLFGAAGVLTGQKLVAGACGALWGYLAAAGAYELNRRKFNWLRGRRYGDYHLLGGTFAVSFGLIVSGAIHETMPAISIVPALSAVLQADSGHDRKYLTLAHVAMLATGLGVGIWFYQHRVFGQVLIDRLTALP